MVLVDGLFGIMNCFRIEWCVFAFGFIINWYFWHQNTMMFMNGSNVLDENFFTNLENTCIDVKHIEKLEQFNGSIFFICIMNILHWILYWFLLWFVLFISQWVIKIQCSFFFILLQIMVVYGNQNEYWSQESILGWKVELAWIRRSLHHAIN